MRIVVGILVAILVVFMTGCGYRKPVNTYWMQGGLSFTLPVAEDYEVSIYGNPDLSHRSIIFNEEGHDQSSLWIDFYYADSDVVESIKSAWHCEEKKWVSSDDGLSMVYMERRGPKVAFIYASFHMYPSQSDNILYSWIKANGLTWDD